MDDPFNLDAPRQCPYCHERVLMQVKRVPGPNATTTTTIDPEHDEPVCDQWKATRDTQDMKMHLLAGTAPPAVSRRLRWSKPLIVASLASLTALFLSVVPNWGGPYDVNVAILTATLLAVIWYTYFTYQSVAASAEQVRQAATVKRNLLRTVVATIRFHLQRLPLGNNRPEDIQHGTVWDDADISLILQLAAEYGTVAAHHATRVAPALRWVKDQVENVQSIPQSEGYDWRLFPWTDGARRWRAPTPTLPACGRP
jgi:hypothetical protein